jgi:predicted RNA-binding protein YlxR (DUF448 family)
MTGPLRRCAGCGRRLPQHQLQRFVARAGRLTPAAPGERGRGVYTCHRLRCFEQATARRAFARALRTSVTIEATLTRLYTDADGR